jgi:dephospho-CoA kinase
VQGGAKWVVQDVPLLFEGEAWKSMDAVLLVDAPLQLRLERVLARGGLTREAVLARDAAQMPIAQKRALLDQLPGRVIDNGGTELQLAEQLGGALEQLGVLPR